MDLGFEGRRVVVVGATAGIGEATARMLAAEGAQLVIAARDAARLEAVADAIAAAGHTRPGTCAADLTRKGDAERLVEAAAERWDGAMDALVDAVGGSIRSEFEGLSDEQWLANYEFNVLSAVRVVRAALPKLRAGRDPAVVLLGAASSRMPYPHQVASNVHKAGLLALVKTLAGELAPENIRVNCVAPGRTLTRLWQDRATKLAAERGVPFDEVIAEFARDIPLGRFASAEEVAVAVAWLASPRTSYVTGQTWNIDGGIARGLL